MRAKDNAYTSVVTNPMLPVIDASMSKKSFPVFGSENQFEGGHEPNWLTYGAVQPPNMLSIRETDLSLIKPFPKRANAKTHAERVLLAKSMIAYSDKMKEITENRSRLPFMNAKEGRHLGTDLVSRSKHSRQFETYEWPYYKELKKEKSNDNSTFNKSRPRSGMKMASNINYTGGNHYLPRRSSTDPLKKESSSPHPGRYRRYGIDTTYSRIHKLKGETNVLSVIHNPERRISVANSLDSGVGRQVEHVLPDIGVKCQPAVFHQPQVDAFTAVMRQKEDFIGYHSENKQTDEYQAQIANSTDSRDPSATVSVDTDVSSSHVSDSQKKKISTETITPQYVENHMQPMESNSNSSTKFAGKHLAQTATVAPAASGDKSKVSIKVGDKSNVAVATASNISKTNDSNVPKPKGQQTIIPQLKVELVEDTPMSTPRLADANILSPKEKSVQQAHYRLFGQSINESDVKKRLEKPKVTSDVETVEEIKTEISLSDIQDQPSLEREKPIKKKKSVKFGPEMIREVTKIEYPWYNESSDEDDDDDSDDEDEDDDEEDEDEDEEEKDKVSKEVK